MTALEGARQERSAFKEAGKKRESKREREYPIEGCQSFVDDHHFPRSTFGTAFASFRCHENI